MALQHQAQPAQVLLAAQIRQRERHPEVGPGGDRPAQRGDDGLDVGEIIVAGRFARLEAVGLGDHRALLGRLLGKVVDLEGPVVPEDDDCITGIDGLSHPTTPSRRPNVLMPED